MSGRFIGIALLLAAGLCLADGRKLELRGRIEPPPREFAAVTLHGSDFPFNATKLSGPGGKFQFKKVDPGQYTVIVFLPGRGTVRRTVSITPSLADEKGRVRVTIPFQPSGEALAASGTVSVRELTIPRKAKREYERAQKQLSKRNVDAAIAHLKKAVEIAPNHVAAWNNLGTIAYQTARYRDAEKYFRTALRYEPGAYSPVVNLGGALLALNEFKEALKYNLYALELRPLEALPNSQLGLNYHYLGDDDRAIKYLTKAREIDPNHFSQPQLTLGKIYASRGDLNNAVRELRDYVKRHPDSPTAEGVRKWLAQVKRQAAPQR